MRTAESPNVGVKSGLPTLVWALLGLLVAASVLFLFARDDTKSLPSAESTLPSGTAAFAEILRRDGFIVSIEPYKRPKLPPDALVIAFHVQETGFFETIGAMSEVENPTAVALEDWIEAGRTMIGIEIASDFTQLTKAAQTSPISRDGADNQSKPVAISQAPVSSGSFPVAVTDPIPLWSDGTRDMVTLGDLGKGVVVTVNDGLGMTNRFIDKEANARFYLDLVRTYAPPSRKVVFAEGLLSTKRERGLLQDIGPYASAAWWQFVLVSVVVVFTLGKRFGLPEVERKRERGVRELVDAVAQTMERGRQFPLALDLMARDIDLRVRRLISIDNQAPRQDRNRLLSPELAAALNAAENPGSEKLKPKEAEAIALRLLAAFGEFEKNAKRPLARRE
ncbi:MAG: hypothetical protein K1X67_18050 [Fimbriimonadaceae bacterium]|nr:hypothetical protein [Fimbriimonadaceae bacterium]